MKKNVLQVEDNVYQLQIVKKEMKLLKGYVQNKKRMVLNVVMEVSKKIS